MKHRRPSRIAGPFRHEADAFLYLFEGHRWVSSRHTRRYRDGWWVLARSQATVHPGSKAWRRKMHALLEAEA